jgi:TonB-linked SusC/RagA family outer membrane protein
MKIRLLLASMAMFISAMTFGQGSTEIRGLVKDDKGVALSNITVTEKGTTNITKTNAAGEFKIGMKSANGTLVFSGVGFQSKESNVEEGKIVSIALVNDVKELSDVVVVGYATQKKANLTGAVDQVSGDMLENRPITRVTQALQGTIGNLNITTNTNGGTPNATQSINIRGFTGFGTSGSPLIVIDGIATSGTGAFNNLNPNDVESISVLKDQASAAIYGVDGAYGVILVTTKSGKKNKKPQITFSSNFDYSQMMNLPHLVSSLEWANVYNEANRNAGNGDYYPADQMQRMQDYIDGKLTTETQPNSTGTGWTSGNGNNDWFDVIFKDFAVNQQYNVGVSGGSANSSYFIGLGYLDKKGMFRYGNDEYKRYNLRANLSTDVTDWMKFNLRTSYARTNYNTPYEYPGLTGGGLSSYLHNAARSFTGNALYLPNGYFNPAGSLVALMAYGGRSISDGDELQLSGEFVMSPLKGWDITANYTLFSGNGNSIANGSTIFIPNPDGTLASTGVTPNSVARGFSKSANHLINLFSSYEKRLNGHNFKILGGYIRRYNTSLSMNGSNTNLYTDNLPALSLTYGTTPTLTDDIAEYATEGFFGRFNYSFHDKYLIEFNGRYDATSKFIYNRWAFFPGVSAGYVISKEKFWDPVHKYINNFKLRASYGKSGDQSNFGNYPFYPTLPTTRASASSWYFGSSTQAYVSQAGDVNPNITWAKPVMIDFGVDMGFLKNRLQISADVYRRTITDMLVASQPLPAVFGTTAPQTNAGEMHTDGFEITATWNDRIGKDLKYSVRGVLSNYNGYIDEYPNPTKLLANYYNGQKLGNIWGYTANNLYTAADTAGAAPASFWTGIWTPGDVHYLDLDKSGRVDAGKNTADSSGDMRIIGNNVPQYSYSLNLDAEYKGFDLTIFVQGVAKREVFMSSNYFWGIASGAQPFQNSVFTSTRDRWTTENPGGYLPKFYLSAQNQKNLQTSSRYLQNAAYLRLKSVQLGYSLPASLMKKINIQKLRLYVTAENLATITKMWQGIDPELAIGDGKIYPLQRSFSFGLNLTL